MPETNAFKAYLAEMAKNGGPVGKSKKDGKLAVVLDELSNAKKQEIFGTEENENPIEWSSKTPTRYNLGFSGEGKSILLFSQSYDPLWSAKGVSSLPVYGFINGFIVESNRNVVVEYLPQRYIQILFPISSAVFIAVIVIYFACLRRKV